MSEYGGKLLSSAGDVNVGVNDKHCDEVPAELRDKTEKCADGFSNMLLLELE